MMENAAPVFAYAELGSTNDEARRLYTEGVAMPFWVTAQAQTSGRGRNGRVWHSPAGNLHATYVFTKAIDAPAATQLSFVAGLAAAEAIEALATDTQGSIRLKWPNDVMMDGAKVAGLLLESWPGKTSVRLCVAIGVGINLCSSPNDLHRPVAHLGLAPSQATSENALHLLSDRLYKWIGIWNSGFGFSVIRQAWLDRAFALDRHISVSLNDRPIQGIFRGLDSSGSLMLETGPNIFTTVTAGDVSIEDSAHPAHDNQA